MTSTAVVRRLAVLAAVIVVSGTAASCGRSGTPSASPTPAPAATVTETVTETATPTPTSTPTASAASTSASTRSPSPSASATTAAAPRAFGFVRQVITKEGEKQLVWDRAVLLTGAAAAKAKKAHGIDPSEPPDYYILNDDTSQKLYPLAPGYTVVGSTFFGKPPAGAPVSRATFEKAFPSKNPPAMYVYFDDADRVVKVVEFYTP